MSELLRKLDHNPIIAGLDGMLISKALNLAQQLKGHIWGSKGNNLLDQDPNCVVRFKEIDGFFADTKFHDTPETVRNRVLEYVPRKPDFISVHAAGGIPMMRAAIEAANTCDPPIKILAITILTSLNHDDCIRIYGLKPEDKVVQLAMMAKEAGVFGIVSSAKELKILAEYKRDLGDLKKIAPGIGPKWYQDLAPEQKRVMTPIEAINLGADFLVLGRAITKAPDPVQAVLDTLKEIGFEGP